MSSTAKNTFLMLAGSIGQKLVSLVYFTFLARMLGKAQTGEYTAALAMSTLFVVFIDLGLTNVLIRDGSQSRADLPKLFSSVLTIKLFTGLLSYLALLAACFILKFEVKFIELVIISGVTMLVDSFHLSLYGYLRAHSRLKYEAVGMVMSQAITLVTGTACLLLKLPLISLMFSFLFASLCNAGYAYYWSRKHGLTLHFVWELSLLKKMIIVSLPFALAVIFGRFYSYVDVVLLKKIAGNAEVGIYSTPSKISFAFQFIPLAFMAALYPRLSELYKTNQILFRKLLTDSLIYLLLIALPMSIGIFLLAKPIILLTFSEEYLGSVFPLKILILSLIFSFISFPLGAALNASHHEKWQTRITGLALVGNILANVILIPKFGATGAAYSAFVGNIILGTAGFLFLPKEGRVLPELFFGRFLKLLLAGAIMAFVIILFLKSLPLIPLIILGGVVYSVVILSLKVVSIEEIRLLRQSLRAKEIEL